MYDPSTGRNIGVEVKTTLGDTIVLDKQQVSFDVTVQSERLGPAISSSYQISVTGVAYYTYCFECGSIAATIRPALLAANLMLYGVPVTYGPQP